MKLYPNGRSAEIVLTAGESIAVFTKGVAQVLRKLGYPNVPDTISNIGEVNNEQTVFGPYASGATIIIDAGVSDVFYSKGLTPSNLEAMKEIQGTPGVLNATGTLTTAMIMAGIVTSTTAAAVAATLDTGAVLDDSSSFEVGNYFDWTAVATGANAFTVTASAGHTLEGSGVVATVTSGRFRTRKTAADTFITTRLS